MNLFIFSQWSFLIWDKENIKRVESTSILLCCQTQVLHLFVPANRNYFSVSFHFILQYIFLSLQEFGSFSPPAAVKLFQHQHFLLVCLCCRLQQPAAEQQPWTRASHFVSGPHRSFDRRAARRDIMTGCRGVFTCPAPPTTTTPPHPHHFPTRLGLFRNSLRLGCKQRLCGATTA